MIVCNQDISKTITAMSLKFGQVIEDNESIIWWKFLKSYFFSVIALCKFLAIMIFCNQDISKTITAMSFKVGHVIEDDEWKSGENLKKSCWFFFVVFLSYCPLQIFGIENL